VQAPPDDLDSALVLSALADHWRLKAVSIAYLPVGWGSHHWDVTDNAGTRWFVTVDELDVRRWSTDEPWEDSYRRLESSLLAATDLAAIGHKFVHAPVPAVAGTPLVRTGSRFAVSLYPYVTGQSFSWGEFASPEHRLAVTNFLADIHSAPAEALGHAQQDDFTITRRDALQSALDSVELESAPESESGPYTEPTRNLIKSREPVLRDQLRRYDDLAAKARAVPHQVLTHGEPHPGNTMLTAAGWLMIDWDTTMISLPERDLWDLDPGDGSITGADGAYQRRTGREPRPEFLTMFGLRWDLTDLALAAARFSEPHGTDANDQNTFRLIPALLNRLDRT
jgi:spectinomycin phosphotransferase/16S rRNA (guanine(1405)-N(7))-methyltransferase